MSTMYENPGQAAFGAALDARSRQIEARNWVNGAPVSSPT
jgi:hypothetical protein